MLYIILKNLLLLQFPSIPSNWNNPDLNNKWTELIKIRDKCNSSIEIKRASKEIGSSLEVSLTINLNNKLMKLAKGIDFSELCITSSAKIKELKKGDSDEIKIETIKAEGNKCPVCWKINKNKCERHSNQ